MHRVMTQKQTHNSLATATSAEAAWSRLTTGSMQLTAEAVRACISCSRGLQLLFMRVAAQIVCKPVIVVYNVRFTLFGNPDAEAKITTAMYQYGGQ
jgi:hypothetical protein